MKIRVIYLNNDDYAEFEYYSEYNRENAKGIKDEIISKMVRLYHKEYQIVDWYRI